MIRHDFISSTMAWGTATFAVIYTAAYSGHLLKAIIQESSSLLKMYPESSSDMKIQSFTSAPRLSWTLGAGTGCFQISSEMFALPLHVNKKPKNPNLSPQNHNGFVSVKQRRKQKYFSNILHEEKFLLLEFLLQRLFWFCNFCTQKDSVFKVHLKP